MSSPLSKKLVIKPGTKGLIMQAPDGFTETLSLPSYVELKSREGKDYDFVIGFTKYLADALILVPKMQKTLKHDGLFWLCYPKKTAKMESDLSRDILWKEMKAFGIDAVSMVSINETWSAMRFRPVELVKRKK